MPAGAADAADDADSRGQRPRLQNFFKFSARNLKLNRLGFDRTNGSGLPATMRRTIEQGAGALMWSVRMIGVALAFLAPWIIALAAAIGIVRGVRRSRRRREN